MTSEAVTLTQTDPSTDSSASNLEDINLLRACRQGDAQAWQRLLDKYERLVFSIARNTGLNRDDAADITQQTFTFLLQGLDTMRNEGHLAGWLATVARRHSRRLLVRQLRYESRQVEPDVVEMLMPGRAKTESIEHWELAEWLRIGLNRLNDRCRQLLIALYFEPDEPSYAEVAEQLGMAEGSVGPTRARCLEQLRKRLGA